jgi:hypothetical protein
MSVKNKVVLPFFSIGPKEDFLERRSGTQELFLA